MKKYFGFLIITVFVTVCSCDEYLDRAPLNSPSNESFYSTEEEVLMAINACYNNITAVNIIPGSNETLWPHLVNAFYRDHVTDIAATRLGTILFDPFKKGALNASSDLASREWSYYYTGIGRTNALLEGMVKAKEVMPVATYNRVESEARVIRAICYLNLILNYGDVPFVDKVINADNVEEAYTMERSPKAEILQFIYSEIDQAVPALPKTYTGSNRGRITQGAAYAMKARIALYMGDFTIAKASADSVIKSGTYKLYNSYRNLFTYRGQYNSEIILDFQYKNPERVNSMLNYNGPRNNSVGQSQSFPTEDLVASFECTDGLPIDESPLYDPTNPFVDRDPRLRGAIILPRVWDGTTVKTYGTVFNGIEYMSSKEKLFELGSTTNILAASLSKKEEKVLDTKTGAQITNQEVTNNFSSFTGYCVYKYIDSTDVAANQNCHTNFILSRYAEVLLIYAEAAVELNQIDQSVLDAINMIRARAYGNTNESGVTDINATNYPKITTMDQAELRKVIRRERKVELCFEGFRLDDLKRWGLLTDALDQRTNNGRPDNYTKLAPTDIPQIDDNGLVTFPYATQTYGLNNEMRKLRFFETFGVIPEAFNLFPIPLGERQLNPNLSQNPDYN